MSKRFDRLLEKATDSTLIEPNWDAIIECVDLIRGGETPVKLAVASIRRRYHNENPHVAHHALLVLEACMKNCGNKFHAEVATKDFMEDLKNLSLDNTPDKVKNKILELLHCWAIAFKDKPEYKIVVDTHNLMKFAGFEFPEVTEAEAMFVAESAPEWADGDECFRCRTAFGILTRKHHCRACGQIFCDKCSSKQSYLPQYGIEKQVRVCDGCFDKTPSAKEPSSIITSSNTQPSAILSKSEKPLPVDAKKTAEERERELKQAEEDELNLALAISQSEAEAQEEERQRRIYQMYNGTDAFGVRSQPSTNPAAESSVSDRPENFSYKGTANSKRSDSESAAVPSCHEPDVDPELARYLNRDYWQRRKNEQKNANNTTTSSHINAERRKTPTPTAPPPSESSLSRSDIDNNLKRNLSSEALSVTSTVQQLDGNITPTQHFVGVDEEETVETMEFCKQLNEQVTVMDNRIRSNIARNRSIVNDTAIQSLFIRLTEMHAQVMARMNKLEDQRNYFESLQDHLAHIQEARQAVNALREDYESRKQQRALEEQRLRQQQMQQKVDLMRQKKHELLLHQRHMALLRFQQQEQELQMRRVQQQQQQQPAGYYPGQPAAPQLPYAAPQQIGVSSLQNQAPAVLQQAYYADGAQQQQYLAQQYGYPPGTTIAYAADPNQSLPQIPQQVPSADQVQSQTQVGASVGPQVISSQQVNEQQLVNAQANVAPLQQPQYPVQQQQHYMPQPVMNGNDHSQQQQKPIVQSDSQTPTLSVSNPTVTSNGKMHVPISSASNPIINAAYNGKVIPQQQQQQQQSFMYQQQQGMMPQTPSQVKVAGTDYGVYQQQPAATVPNAGYAQPAMALPNSTVQNVYVPPPHQYTNAGDQYYQNQATSQMPSSGPVVQTQTAAVEQAQPEVQQPSEGLLISFD